MFIVGSAIELVALHVFIPWPAVRLVVDVLSLWSLVWMVGYMANLRVHPHLISDAGLRIRNGAGHDIAVPWEAVEAMTIRERTLDKARTLHLERVAPDTILSVVMASRTNVQLTLGRPVVAPLRSGPEPVTELRFYADDPRALVSRAREHRAKQH